MVKKTLLLNTSKAAMFCLCLTFFVQGYSQEDTNVSFNQKFVLKANIIGLGISAEYNFHKNFTIHNQISFKWHLSFFNNTVTVPYWPQYIGSSRWYYSFNRRERLGKNTNFFSANYFAVMTRIHLAERDKTIVLDNQITVSYFPGNYVGLQHGFQRSFLKSKKAYFDFNIGYGVNFHTKNHPEGRISTGFNGMLGIGVKL
jgi:hypothetical protein